MSKFGFTINSELVNYCCCIFLQNIENQRTFGQVFLHVANNPIHPRFYCISSSSSSSKISPSDCYRNNVTTTTHHLTSHCHRKHYHLYLQMIVNAHHFYTHTDDIYIYYIYIRTPKTIEKVNLHSSNEDIPTSITQFLTMELSEYVNARLGRLRSRAGHRCFAGRRHCHRWVSGISPRNGDFMGFCLQSQNLKGKTEGRWGVMSISWKILWCRDKMIYGLSQNGGFILKRTRIQSFNIEILPRQQKDNEKEWDWTDW